MMNFKEVYAINVNEWTEKKNNLTYLSWAMAWKSFMEVYPNAKYEIVKDANGTPAFGSPELGYMCYTRVTVDDVTHEMWLPVMDFRNKAIKTPDMFDVNKTIMRCLTKNLAMFGLGLYIYAGEDFPNEEDKDKVEEKEMKASVKPVTIQDLQNLVTEKGKSPDWIIKTFNANVKENEKLDDVNKLPDGAIIGLYKLLQKSK